MTTAHPATRAALARGTTLPTVGKKAKAASSRTAALPGVSPFAAKAAPIIGSASRAGRHYTKEEDQLVADMHRFGKTWVDIGKALGRRPDAVSQRARTMGIVPTADMPSSANRIHPEPPPRRRPLGQQSDLATWADAMVRQKLIDPMAAAKLIR